MGLLKKSFWLQYEKKILDYIKFPKLTSLFCSYRELDNDFRASDPHHHSHLDNLPELKGDVGTHGHDEEFHKGRFKTYVLIESKITSDCHKSSGEQDFCNYHDRGTNQVTLVILHFELIYVLAEWLCGLSV